MGGEGKGRICTRTHWNVLLRWPSMPTNSTMPISGHGDRGSVVAAAAAESAGGGGRRRGVQAAEGRHRAARTGPGLVSRQISSAPVRFAQDFMEPWKWSRACLLSVESGAGSRRVSLPLSVALSRVLIRPPLLWRRGLILHWQWRGRRGEMVATAPCSTRRSFRDSLKVLEADIQHTNTLASECSRDYDGACLQMRMSYNPAARLFLFLLQWTDCSLAGALGLHRILIYKVYVDSTTTMSTHERMASIREFYSVIFPSLMQLDHGIIDSDDRRQRAACLERYRRRGEPEDSKRPVPEIDAEIEEECGICMELNSKVVLTNCSHDMCIKCYRQWVTEEAMLPFCLFSALTMVVQRARHVVHLTMVVQRVGHVVIFL